MGTTSMQKSWRKACGAIKDSTTVGLAKVNSSRDDLDVAVVKATSHVERPPKDRHLASTFRRRPAGHLSLIPLRDFPVLTNHAFRATVRSSSLQRSSALAPAPTSRTASRPSPGAWRTRATGWWRSRRWW
jgi:hypothetical protein